MKSAIIVLLTLFSLTGTGTAQRKDASKTIRITKASFSAIYPAVWFAPSTGAITPLTERTEKPPKNIYKIWIEPNDPEISTLDPNAAVSGEQGFQLIGHGKALFEKPVLPKKRQLTHKLRGPDIQKPLAVFLFVDGKQSYVMLVEFFSKTKQELTFRWEALDAQK